MEAVEGGLYYTAINLKGILDKASDEKASDEIDNDPIQESATFPFSYPITPHMTTWDYSRENLTFVIFKISKK